MTWRSDIGSGAFEGMGRGWRRMVDVQACDACFGSGGGGGELKCAKCSGSGSIFVNKSSGSYIAAAKWIERVSG